MADRLGILAGGGALPREIIEAVEAEGRQAVLVGFAGQTDEETYSVAPLHLRTKLGQIGEMIEFLRREQVRDLVMAGKIHRPSLGELKLDWVGLKYVAKLGLSSFGDDGVMRRLIQLFENDGGFRILSVPEVLHQATAPSGAMTKGRPDEEAEADIRRGIEVLRSLGPADVGQAVVVQQGVVLAIEAIEGTDAMIKRAGDLRRKGPGGVLVKLKKPQQERRADLPVVGLGTVKAALAAGLRGMALEAGGTLVVERKEMIATAERAGFFIVGVELQDEPSSS